MTQAEAVKRSEKSQWLRVWQMDSTNFYVESEDGRIAYRTNITDDGFTCQCGDYAKGHKNDPSFKCKHIHAIMNAIPKDEVMDAQLLERRKPRLDERFIKQVEGKDFVLYAGLLNLAHQKNLISIDVELLQYPTKENDHIAVCKASAETSRGEIFVDLGDANPLNCNSKVAKHLIRMASTRAKARCLRDLCDIGITCLEELGDLSEVLNDEDGNGKATHSRRNNVKRFPDKQVNLSQDKSRNEASEGDKNNQDEVHATGSIKDGTDVHEPAQDDNNQTNMTSPSEHVDTEKQPRPRQTAKNGNGKGNGKSKPDQVPMMSEAQKNAIYNLSRRRNISVEELENLAMKTFNAPLMNLTSSDASMFIRTLQQAS